MDKDEDEVHVRASGGVGGLKSKEASSKVLNLLKKLRTKGSLDVYFFSKMLKKWCVIGRI